VSPPVPVAANVVPSSPILVTLTMRAIHSSETSVLTRATRGNDPDDGILHVRLELTEMGRVNMTTYIGLIRFRTQFLICLATN
jgi:hypothetical protein